MPSRRRVLAPRAAGWVQVNPTGGKGGGGPVDGRVGVHRRRHSSAPPRPDLCFTYPACHVSPLPGLATPCNAQQCGHRHRRHQPAPPCRSAQTPTCASSSFTTQKVGKDAGSRHHVVWPGRSLPSPLLCPTTVLLLNSSQRNALRAGGFRIWRGTHVRLGGGGRARMPGPSSCTYGCDPPPSPKVRSLADDTLPRRQRRGGWQV